jgi:hypothetical protein
VPAHLTAVARAIRILRPAALADMPSSRAATNRRRKSEEYGFPIHADPLHGSQHESEIAPGVNPYDSTRSRATLVIFRSSKVNEMESLDNFQKEIILPNLIRNLD